MIRKISVIIPVFNVKDYLEKCIESVIGQTYQNLEIILVNDGSSDGSGEICDKYAQTDRRIRVIHKENRGVSAARNTGIETATGDFIAFLDSDDWVDEDMYEMLYRLIEEYQADISICRLREVFNNETVDESTGQILICDNVEALKYMFVMTNNYYVCHSPTNKLFKKEMIQNMLFPVGVLMEDLYFIPKVVYNSRKCVYQDTARYNYYCERPGSTMNSSMNSKKVIDELNGYREIERFLKEKELPELGLIMKERYLGTLMKFHFLVKSSSLDSKKSLMEELERRFEASPYKESRKEMSKNLRIKLFLFEKSPFFSSFVRFLFQRYCMMKGKKKLRKLSSGRQFV